MVETATAANAASMSVPPWRLTREVRRVLHRTLDTAHKGRRAVSRDTAWQRQGMGAFCREVLTMDATNERMAQSVLNFAMGMLVKLGAGTLVSVAACETAISRPLIRQIRGVQADI